MKNVLKSRKFWALITALVATGGAVSLGDITQLEALKLAVDALMIYIGAVAVEDGLRNRQ